MRRGVRPLPCPLRPREINDVLDGLFGQCFSAEMASPKWSRESKAIHRLSFHHVRHLDTKSFQAAVVL